MNKTVTGIAVLLALSPVFGCSSGDDAPGSGDGGAGGSSGSGGSVAVGGTGGTGEPLAGFAKVYKDIIQRGCLGPLCHLTPVAGDLVMTTASEAYDALIEQPASPDYKCGPADGGTALTRVVPGKPEQSLLYLKLLDPPPCGERMPESAQLTDAEIGEIRAWIADGAPAE